MNQLDGTTMASYIMVVLLLRKLRVKKLLSADEVAEMLDYAMLECEADGVDDATTKAGRRLLKHVRSVVLDQALTESGEAGSQAISREAA